MSARETSLSSTRRRSSCASPARACAKVTSTTSPSRAKRRTIPAGGSWIPSFGGANEMSEPGVTMEEAIMAQSAKRVVLASRPVGEPKPSDFRIEDYTPPSLGDGEVLLRTIWLSLDPYMRGRMSDATSYAAAVPDGGVMEGGPVGEVVAS